MNPAHLHLMMNHIPVLGTAFGFLLLLFGIWKKSGDIHKAGLGILVLATLLAIPAYVSGEPAEEVVEDLPGVSHAIIEEHEEMAAVAFTAQLVLGIGSLIVLVVSLRGKPCAPWALNSLLVVALIVTVIMVWTANLGGQIRHTEIRADGQGASSHSDHDD